MNLAAKMLAPVVVDGAVLAYPTVNWGATVQRLLVLMVHRVQPLQSECARPTISILADHQLLFKEPTTCRRVFMAKMYVIEEIAADFLVHRVLS